MRIAMPLMLAITLVAAPAGADRTIVEIDHVAETTGFSLLSQSPTQVTLRYAMDHFTLESSPAGVSVGLSGVFLPNQAGAPNLPTLGRFVALPQGATARLEIVNARTRSFRELDVGPAPVIPKENDPAPLIYREDPAIYGADAYYPAAPAALSPPRRMRGVDAVAVSLTPFQYHPGTRELIAYTEIELRIHFEGGNGIFGEDALRNRYWEPILQSHLLNYESLQPIDFDARSRDGSGCEYIILTPDDPDFIAWGDSIRTWRQAQGIHTACFTTTDIGGGDSTVIRTWLHDAYNNWDIRPAGFLLLGDYPNSGDRDTGIISPTWNYYCVSDNIYADADGDDGLPDLFHGRITARNAAELETIIGRMFDYERSPSVDAGFYQHPLISVGWELDRWFGLCGEIVLGFQQHVLGRDPVRAYALCMGQSAPRREWSDAQNTSLVVDYFGPDGLGYIPATPEHLEDWDGDSTAINNAINSGAYLVLHRDHGVRSRWDHPEYSIDHLAYQQNTAYPFVFSINCLTGRYNSPDPCLAEAWHRLGTGDPPSRDSFRGAVGLIAASESSYSFVNDAMVWGMFDGLWPEFDPGYAGDVFSSASLLRPGVTLAYGKYYLEASGFPNNPQQKLVTYHLFHFHGDPFQQMYSEVPQPLTVDHEETCPAYTSTFTVSADEGSMIALTVNGEIIATAGGTGQPQAIPIPMQTEVGTLRITVTKPNYFRYDQSIPITLDPQAVVVPASGNRILALATNPFFRISEIRYQLPSAGPVKLSIFDPTGAKVATLVDGVQEAGPQTVMWNGASLPGGVYFAHLQAGGREVTRKAVLLK